MAFTPTSFSGVVLKSVRYVIIFGHERDFSLFEYFLANCTPLVIPNSVAVPLSQSVPSILQIM